MIFVSVLPVFSKYSSHSTAGKSTIAHAFRRSLAARSAVPSRSRSPSRGAIELIVLPFADPVLQEIAARLAVVSEREWKGGPVDVRHDYGQFVERTTFLPLLVVIGRLGPVRMVAWRAIARVRNEEIQLRDSIGRHVRTLGRTPRA